MSENEITITVLGHVAVGKSAVALAILDALRAAGLACTWDDEQSERNLGTGAADIAVMEDRPSIRLIERNPTMLDEAPIGRLQLRQGQIQQLAEFAGVPVDGTAEEDQDVLQLTLGHIGHSGPGLYASFDDVPEGGAIFLGIPEGDPQLLFGTDLPHPANGDERRWFMAGASAVAAGRAFVNAGDSEQQFIADAAAEGVPDFAGMALIDTALGYLSTALDDLASSPDRRPGGMVQEAMACIRQAMIGGVPGAQGGEIFAPEYFTHDGAGLVHFSRVPPAHWPEWATEAFTRMGGGQSLYDDLLAVLEAKDHATARANIGGLRGRVVSLQSQLADAMRRVVDAQRLAWALVDAAGGCVELPPAVIATTDWSGKNLQQLVVPGGGVRFTSTQDARR